MLDVQNHGNKDGRQWSLCEYFFFFILRQTVQCSAEVVCLVCNQIAQVEQVITMKLDILVKFNTYFPKFFYEISGNFLTQ